VWYGDLGEKGNILEPGNRISTSMSSVLDLLTPKSIGNIFLPWVVHMCGIMTLGGKDNVLRPGKSFSSPMSSALDLCPFDANFSREYLPPTWVVYMCGMVTLGEKGNILEPGNRIATSMSSVLDI
jgi:hypothetical protein